jgi:hypothetical protein
MGHPNDPLLEEPVGGLLGLGERLLSARGNRQPLGECVHHVGAGERAHLLGQPVGAGQRGERGVQLRPGGRLPTSALADLGELPLAHPLLSEFARPPVVHLDAGDDDQRCRAVLTEQGMVGQVATRGAPARSRWAGAGRSGAPTPGPTRTASCAGAPSAAGWWSSSGWPSPAAPSCLAACSVAPGPTTAGRADHGDALKGSWVSA